MLLEKFSNIIDSSPIGSAIDYRKNLIERTDPNRIYVENIRSFFHIPNRLAKWLCDEAARQGVFEKRHGFLCPTCHAMIADTADVVDPSKKLICQSCVILNNDRFEYSPNECQRMEFYRVVKNG